MAGLDQLRSMVRPQVMNLATPFPPMPVFDLVFLRNVLIYFDPATKRSVLQRVRRVTAPDGYCSWAAPRPRSASTRPGTASPSVASPSTAPSSGRTRRSPDPDRVGLQPADPTGSDLTCTHW